MAYEELLTNPGDDSFANFVASAIDPWNRVGLCESAKKNMYDYA